MPRYVSNDFCPRPSGALYFLAAPSLASGFEVLDPGTAVGPNSPGVFTPGKCSLVGSPSGVDACWLWSYCWAYLVRLGSIPNAAFNNCLE